VSGRDRGGVAIADIDRTATTAAAIAAPFVPVMISTSRPCFLKKPCCWAKYESAPTSMASAATRMWAWWFAQRPAAEQRHEQRENESHQARLHVKPPGDWVRLRSRSPSRCRMWIYAHEIVDERGVNAGLHGIHCRRNR